MTDEEFFTTLTALRDHAKTRRREEFSAGKNEEEFGEWDSLYSTLGRHTGSPHDGAGADAVGKA